MIILQKSLLNYFFKLINLTSQNVGSDCLESLPLPGRWISRFLTQQSPSSDRLELPKQLYLHSVPHRSVSDRSLCNRVGVRTLITTWLLLNYSLVSAWPTFHFQSMKVTVWDLCPSCHAVGATTQTAAAVRAAVFQKRTIYTFEQQQQSD